MNAGRVISRRSALLIVALAQLAIGAAAVFARFALVSGGALAISFARLSLAALVVVAVAAGRGALRPIDRASEARLFAAGLLLALHFATWISSLRFASVAISTLLVCTTPVWAELAAVIRRRRFDGQAAASIAVALAGVAIVVGAPGPANQPIGIALALIGAVAFAAYLIAVRGTDVRHGTLAITSRTYTYAALALGAAVSSTSAFAQNGPAALNFGAGSNPQTGGQPVAAQPAGRSVYDVAPQGADSQTDGPAGPAGANFGAGSNPQTGNKPFAATTSQTRSASNGPTGVTPGPAGPAGNNFGAGSNPQTGR